MSWKDARTDGEARAASLAEEIRTSGKPPILTDFDTEEDFLFLCPDDPWTHGYHKMVLRAAKRILRKSGTRAELRILSKAAYLAWLTAENLTDSPKTRAAFVGGTSP